LDFGGEEGVADERGGVVVFRGEEHDKEEFEVFLCEVKSGCVAAFVEGESVGSVFFFEFSLQSCGGVSWFEGPSSTCVGSSCCGGSVGSESSREERKEEGKEPERGGEEFVEESEG
jgi:hypothetical protein